MLRESGDGGKRFAVLDGPLDQLRANAGGDGLEAIGVEVAGIGPMIQGELSRDFDSVEVEEEEAIGEVLARFL